MPARNTLSSTAALRNRTMTARLRRHPFSSCFGPIVWVRSTWATQIGLSLSFYCTTAITMALCPRCLSPGYHGSGGLDARSLLLPFIRLCFQCSHLLEQFANLSVMPDNITEPAVTLLPLFLSSAALSLSSFSTAFRTQLISFLIGRGSSSFALMNAIASLKSAMSSVAMVDVERVYPVGIVWKFTNTDVFCN